MGGGYMGKSRLRSASSDSVNESLMQGISCLRVPARVSGVGFRWFSLASKTF